MVAEPLTLPQVMMLTEGQRRAMEDHIACLRSLLVQIPQHSDECEKKTFALVGKMMLVKPARAGGSEAAEARLDAFMEALDDVPHWAVAIAIRKWHRGECGFNEHGERYDYHWAPESADLRRLARIETHDVRARIEFLERLLNAVPYRDCTAELAHGCAAYRGLLMVVGSEPARLAALTFDEAAEIGSRQKEQRHRKDHRRPPSGPVPPTQPSRDPMTPERRERLSAELAERKARNDARRTEPTDGPPQSQMSTQ